MKYPKVDFTKGQTWTDSVSNYYCYLAKKISEGFFQKHHFFVLPYPPEIKNSTIFFPNLELKSSFWTEISKYSENDFIFHFPKSLTDQVAKKLKTNSSLTHKDDIKRIKKRWQKKQAEFFKTLINVFTEEKVKNIDNIYVTIAPFGSAGSFYFEKKNSKLDFYINLQKDYSEGQIAEGIITLLVWLESDNQERWTDNETVVDFLLTKSKMAKIFDGAFTPTLESSPLITESIITDSSTYLAKLGFPSTPSLKINKGNIHIFDQPVLNCFTKTEENILKHFIENKNKLISYDTLGEIFWGKNSYEHFSLESIAKIIEKIRRKLKKEGLRKQIIFSIRNEGYTLYD